MIDVEEAKRELTVLHVRPSEDDPLYTRCLWMTVYIDTKAWRLMVDSDCGAYTHRWPNEDDLHPFRKALSGYLMDESYILGKISKRSKFSPKDTLESIKQQYCDDPDMLEALTDKFSEAQIEFDFYSIINDDDDVPSDLYEELSYVYPSGAVTVARMLRDYVAPALKNGVPEEGQTE